MISFVLMVDPILTDEPGLRIIGHRSKAPWRNKLIRIPRMGVLSHLIDCTTRRDTVSTPFPKQLESPNRKRAYAVLVTCLEDVPPMSQVRGGLEHGNSFETATLLVLPPVTECVCHHL